jgi:ParB-like chromosome segregation protein Spo0J
MSNVVSRNIRVELLQPAQDNPNQMSTEKFDLLVLAIQRFGFLQPLLVRPLKGAERHGETLFSVVDGHHRLLAARKLGMGEVPCVVASGTEDEERALRVGMNNLRGEPDLTMVGSILKELAEAGWSTEQLTVTGFNEDEVRDLMGAVSQDVDAALSPDMAVPSAEDYQAEDAPTKPFLLELEFTARADFLRAKKGLRRAAGKGGDMAAGLMVLLGEDTKRKEAS